MKPQTKLLFDPEDDQMKDIEMHIFDDEASGLRTFCTKPRESRDKSFLGSVKKVYGGAFTGHVDAFRQEEHEVIECFMNTAESFSYLPGKGVSANRKRLFRHSHPIVEGLRGLFGNEVDIYLKSFADAISKPENPLQWDLNDNNCQQFSRNLLSPLEDSISNLFHRIPRNFYDGETARMKKEWPWPRYLLSFGPEIDTPMALLRPQDRSLFWNFYHKKRDDCDTIEFAEQFRERACPAPADAWKILCDSDLDPEHEHSTRIHDMSISDALWALPRDSVSILQTHLMRSWERYSSSEDRILSPKQWILNRLRVLTYLNIFGSLCSGLAVAQLLELGRNINYLPLYYYPTASEHGILYVSERVVAWRTGPIWLAFITGRERDRWKRETRHEMDKFLNKIRRRNRSKVLEEQSSTE